MPMRQNCKHFESRSYPNGDTVRKCNLDLAPEAPWRCPEDCPSFTKRRVDVNWSHGALITPETPDEPAGLGEDESIAALLDAAGRRNRRRVEGPSEDRCPRGSGSNSAAPDDSCSGGRLIHWAPAGHSRPCR